MSENILLTLDSENFQQNGIAGICWSQAASALSPHLAIQGIPQVFCGV